jgi:hypothetical protein
MNTSHCTTIISLGLENPARTLFHLFCVQGTDRELTEAYGDEVQLFLCKKIYKEPHLKQM